MIGGGQLARMTQQAAISLGVGFRVLAASPHDSAAQVVAGLDLGRHDDEEAVVRFASRCDVVTFDHEHVPQHILKRLEREGTVVRPGSRALEHAQDKIRMRQALSDIGVPCPQWRQVEQVDEVVDFASQTGWPVVLKASRGGYDGRGVWVVDDAQTAGEVLSQPLSAPGAQWLAEQFVGFDQEVAAQVARSPHGQAVAYPVVRTVQTQGICTEVVAPCPDLDPDLAVSAQQIALRIAGELGVIGMLAVELFVVDGGVLVNELAMRPHNSGHWSIHGAVTSQFENHLRAVLDLPLGDPTARAGSSVMVNVLGGRDPDLYPAYRHVQARDPRVHLHMYGKEVRPGRKIGHVTVVGDDLADLRSRARHAADYLSGSIDE